MTNVQHIVEIRSTVKDIVSNGEVVNALAQTTFNGLEPANIPKALLEGMMRGYTLEDFLVKKIYAIPFKNNRTGKQDYSLVTSIADSRSIAIKAGQTGKSEPRYEFSEDGKKIISCSVTVWRKGGDDRGYTATVFFDEYTTGKNLWLSKPRTMIAKVAEMHALRMAFPDDLSQSYIEEEFEKEIVKPESRIREVETLKEESNLTMGKNISQEYEEIINIEDGEEPGEEAKETTDSK